MDELFPLRVCSHGEFCWHCGGTIKITGPRYVEPAAVKEICARYGFYPSLGFLYLQGDLRLGWVDESSPVGFFVEMNQVLVQGTTEECPSDLVPERSRVCSGYVVRSPLLCWTGLSLSGRTFEYNYAYDNENFMGGFSISPDGHAGMTSEARIYNASCVLRWLNGQSKRTHELWPLILWCIKHGDLEEVSHVLLSWTGKKRLHERALIRKNWEILFDWMAMTEKCHRLTVNGWATEAPQKNWLLLHNFLTPASTKPYYQGPRGWTDKIDEMPADFDSFFYQYTVPEVNLHAMLTFGSRNAVGKHLSNRWPHRIDCVRANNAPPHPWGAAAEALCFAEQGVSGDTSIPDVSVPSFVDSADIPERQVFNGIWFNRCLATTRDKQVIEEYSKQISPLGGSDQRCTDDNGCRWPDREDLRFEAPRACCKVPPRAAEWEIRAIENARFIAQDKLGGVD